MRFSSYLCFWFTVLVVLIGSDILCDADDPLHGFTDYLPRAGMHITGLAYSSGVWQFKGFAFVPCQTSGAMLVQIHGVAFGDTSTILRIYDGNMRYHGSNLVHPDLSDKLKVNIIHDVDERKVTVFRDYEQKFQTRDHGPGDLYYKSSGVYTTSSNISFYMETTWRDQNLQEVTVQIQE